MSSRWVNNQEMLTLGWTTPLAVDPVPLLCDYYYYYVFSYRVSFLWGKCCQVHTQHDRTISKSGFIWSSPDYGRVNILSGTFSKRMQIYGCLSIPLNYFSSSLWEWNTSVQIRHNTSRNLPALISSLMCLRIPHADGRCNLSSWKESADSSLLSSGPSVSEPQTRGSVRTWLN